MTWSKRDDLIVFVIGEVSGTAIIDITPSWCLKTYLLNKFQLPVTFTKYLHKIFHKTIYIMQKRIKQ